MNAPDRHPSVNQPSINNPGVNLSVNDYDYELSDELIARYPLAQRSASRLLYLPANQQPQDKQFADLPSLLNQGDLVVFNDTKVMKARLFGQKDTGGQIEVLVERIDPILNPAFNNSAFDKNKNTVDATCLQTCPQNKEHHKTYPYLALCHIKASKAPKLEQHIILANGHMQGKVLARQNNLFVVGFTKPVLPDLEQHGELPIPPYFDRRADDGDDQRYQTVFFDPTKMASVAAPTASLHFDDNILNQLNIKGVNTAFVTLHVGAGTFAPVKTNHILSHKMHSEYAELPQMTADLINQVKSNGGQVVAVGTTVTRVLETAFQKTASFDKPTLSAWAGDTDIFIYLSFKFGVVDRLLTNFHLPKSTLLMLVSAFAGKTQIEHAYQHAIQQKYRFFSYGDAMLLDKLT
ncbi:tRNA preQ1(34) S-adenosylmethionine ribosyltransferase-isomerase QueA [Moraxella lincolnii]|uniref:tRNA preQ1(34) S-adenosylmethionine ribosyltransferase-isomerase QueA n=1 Tax=Lwoffella lincolnii TaxID=90241 RepID=UPI0030CB42C2